MADTKAREHLAGAAGRVTPLRIAVSSFYLPSESKIGAGWMSHRLANALVGLGHEVTMLSPCLRPDDARYAHHQIPMTGSMRTFRWAWELRRIDLTGFDALLAQGDDYLLRRDAVPAHVRTLHGSCFDEAVHVPGAKEKLRMVALGLSELISAVRTPEVVGVSTASLRFFPWRHHVIPNGVDTSLFHPGVETAREEHPTILFVGTYRCRKRGKFLQDLFESYVRPRVPSARLWMVCDDAPASRGVEVLGRLTDEELADRYRRAWVFCLPSTYEGFGVPYAEALVSGTAVVATPNRGACEVLERGEAGVLAPDDRLGEELVRMLEDDEWRRKFEAAGRERRDKYDIADIAERYVSLVRSRLGVSRR